MTKKFARYEKYDPKKHGTSPVHQTVLPSIFMTKEAQELYESADENVKAAAMALLEATVKRSMAELSFSFIVKQQEQIFAELDELRSKLDELIKGKDA